MARVARVVVPGLAHHVTQRGNHQKDVFFTDSDREMYLTILVEYSRKHGLEVEGYCLMTNHVHLVVVPERADSLAKAIGRTHNDYSRWMHVRQGRTLTCGRTAFIRARWTTGIDGTRCATWS